MEKFLAEFQNFWALVLEVWNEGVLGVSIGQLLVAFFIFLFFFFLRGIFTRFVTGFFRRLTSKTETSLDDQIIAVVEKPLRNVFLILGLFFAAQALPLEGTLYAIIDNITRSLIAFTIFWVIYNTVTPLSALLYRLQTYLTREIIDWMVTTIRWGVILLGAATILQIWGIQVAPLIAGLGLFGVAVALGAQDLFRNLISGISILLEKRFQVGDWIKVDGVVEGTVEQIAFRSTRIRRFDKAPVYVPNQSLSDNAVTNFSAMTYRRITWTIGLEYNSTLDQLKQVRNGIETYLMENDDFVKPPAAALFVRVNDFAASSIDIMIYTFTKTTDWGEWLEIKEAFAYKIKEIVEEAGAGFAFPSQSVYVESLPPSPDEISAMRATEPPRQSAPAGRKAPTKQGAASPSDEGDMGDADGGDGNG